MQFPGNKRARMSPSNSPRDFSAARCVKMHQYTHKYVEAPGSPEERLRPIAYDIDLCRERLALAAARRGNSAGESGARVRA